jgi:hypothetical protein
LLYFYTRRKAIEININTQLRKRNKAGRDKKGKDEKVKS